MVYAAEYGCYCYRQVTAPLNESGYGPGPAHLVPWGAKYLKQQPKRAGFWLNDCSFIRLRQEYPKHVEGFELIVTETHDKQLIRLMTLINELTRKYPEIGFARRIVAIAAVEALTNVMLFQFTPTCIRSDNGSGMVAKALRESLTGLGTGNFYIEPWSP